jgi:hypothetical protein
MSKTARVALVIFISAWSVGTLGPKVGCIWHACPDNGLDLNYGGVVNRVDPGSPADKAGMQTGDRIIPPLPRGITRSPPKVLSFELEHRGLARPIVLRPQPVSMSRPDALRLLAVIASYLVFVVVGSWLVVLRPSVMTWSFYFYCILRRYGDFFFYWPGSDAFYWVNALAFASLGGASCAFVMIFALRFPTDRIEGWRRPLNAVAVALVAILPLAWLYAFVRLDFLGLSSQSLVRALVLVTSAVYGLAAVIFIATLIQSRGDERQRLKWILVFPIVLLLRLAVINIPRSLPEWIFNGLIALAVLIPLTVAYAVIRHRVFDIRFAISRALVYGTLTSLIAGTFLLLDWFMSNQFAGPRYTLTAEIIFALALGSSLNMLHRNVDRLVDGIFFRKRRLAEEQLAAAASAVSRAESFSAVDQFLIHEPVQALVLVSAALFRRNDRGHFVRKLAVGWERGDAEELSSNDALVLHLVARAAPVRVADVAWSAKAPHMASAVLAMPVLLREQVAAIVLYGPHRNGADIDPDEQKSLAPLLERAGAAYDHVDAKALRAKVELLTREREAKEREIARLRSVSHAASPSPEPSR